MLGCFYFLSCTIAVFDIIGRNSNLLRMCCDIYVWGGGGGGGGGFILLLLLLSKWLVYLSCLMLMCMCVCVGGGGGGGDKITCLLY